MVVIEVPGKRTETCQYCGTEFQVRNGYGFTTERTANAGIPARVAVLELRPGESRPVFVNGMPRILHTCSHGRSTDG